MDKKLQVFVSSTFEDLKEERQATFEAILGMGHIPAGMESFPGKNEDQLKIIKKWIDESDIFLLLVGARYGTIYRKTDKSFTHLEFEYAKNKAKKPMALYVMHEKMVKEKRKKALNGNKFDSYEKNTEKFCSFRDIILHECKNRTVFDNIDNLKSKIALTLSDMQDNPKLIGWIRRNEIPNTNALDNVKMLGELSIAKMSNGLNDIEKMRNEIKNAFDIKMIATTARASHYVFFGSQIIHALRNGCKIQILVASKDSEYIKDLHSIQQTNVYGERCLYDLNDELQELTQYYKNCGVTKKHEQVIIGHYRTHFRANILIINNKIGYYTPTLPPTSSAQNISFELTDGKLLTNCLIHFNSVMDDVKKNGIIEIFD